MKFLGTASGEFLEWYKSLPLDVDGFSKDPRYVPKNRRDKYMDAWREWCKRFPNKAKWPEFIHAIILEKQLAATKAAG